MGGLRLWHGMVVIAAAAFLFAVMRLESRCTPMAPFVAAQYVFVPLAIRGALRTGRRRSTGFLLGFFLGPIGSYIAWTERPPEGWADSMS